MLIRFASLLQNSNTSDDVSFNNVDISGIFKLNGIDISNSQIILIHHSHLYYKIL